MKKDQKKSTQKKSIPKVRRASAATAVNENHKATITKRNPFADETGTDISNPNKVTR